MAAKKKTLRSPILPKDLASQSPDRLDTLDLDGSLLESCDLANQRGDYIRFDGVRVVGGAMNDTKLTRVSWLDVVCERCTLSMIDWPAAKLTRVEFQGCRMTGGKLGEGELDDVRFAECHLDFASFARARFRQVVFERCRIAEADFNQADLTGTTFIDCELHGADFTRAKLDGADVSRSTLGELRVDARDLRGLVVSREQAAALSRSLLGLVIQDA
ncbi:pentapeptide repeat-containing protein [Pendulispora rubella]|uniref:Pentapeptide repeat-containing protein n=1 Tax=Pendulispora rubella TaxID=2741070 RepID=A0ABZ2KX82_9BACT